MKLHYKITVLAGLLTILIPLTASAKASTTPIKTLKEKVEAKRDEVKNKIEERKDDARERIETRFAKFMAKVVERLNAAAGRFDKITLRIESRLTKLEDEGADESKARALLITAKQKLDIARISINNVNIAASSTISASTTLKMNYPAIKNVVEKAKDDLKATQAALVDVIRNIKPGKNKDHATSTAATTTATSTED
jgi:chromosome segregation ATPase